MPQRTKLNHPISQLRIAAKLRRKELADLIGVTSHMLEALEREDRRLKPAVIEALYRELGVCPGWIVSGEGPIHTHDGHPYRIQEFFRWRDWREKLGEPEEPAVTPAIGYQGRRLGPLFRKDCCPDSDRSLLYGPIEGSPKGTGSPRAYQKQMERDRIRQCTANFLALARGAVTEALRNPQTAEKTLSEAVSKIQLVFPEAKPEKDNCYGDFWEIPAASQSGAASGSTPTQPPRQRA